MSSKVVRNACLAFALFIGLSSTAFCADEMSTQDNVREGIFAALVFIDYRQSLDIKNHEGMYEINPLMGKHPSDEKFAIACASTVVLHYLVAMNLKPETRRAFQYITIGFEGANVIRNAKIGLSINF